MLAAKADADLRVIAGSELRALEDPFIENWGTLADAFGMDRTVGRIHALIYVSRDPIDEASIAARLNLGREMCHGALKELLAWGVVQVAHHYTDGTEYYTAENDPWAWFIRTVRERRHREFVPMLMSVRNVCDYAREMAGAADKRGDADLQRLAKKIEIFTAFVDELARFIDAFAILGKGPMLMALKTVAKLMPRS